MAFIRWKKNKFGIRQAYLVHSYRDKEGRPRQKTLAYLGHSSELSDDRLCALKEQHKDIAVNFDGIKPVGQPAPQTDIDPLSDQELASRLRELRSERGLNRNAMAKALIQLGVPDIQLYRRRQPFTGEVYTWLERDWSRQNPSHASAISVIAPYLRKVLNGKISKA
jgi:hypothetical protein